MAPRKRGVLVLGDGRKPRVAAVPRIRERAQIAAVDLTERMDPPARRRTSRLCSAETVLTLDGQVFVYLKVGDRLRIQRAAAPLRLVTPPGETYFRRAAEKLGWAPSGPIPEDTRTLR